MITFNPKKRGGGGGDLKGQKSFWGNVKHRPLEGAIPNIVAELMAVLFCSVLFSSVLFCSVLFCQLDNLVLINKIKEQLMAEKIRPPHLPTASAPSQQPGSAPPSQVEAIQHGIGKSHQMQVLQGHIPPHPDVALHARPASSSVTGAFTTTSCPPGSQSSAFSDACTPVPGERRF